MTIELLRILLLLLLIKDFSRSSEPGNGSVKKMGREISDSEKNPISYGKSRIHVS